MKTRHVTPIGVFGNVVRGFTRNIALLAELRATARALSNELEATALLGLERTEEAKVQLQETVTAFKLSPGVQREIMTDWQLLAAAPAPPAGMEEFMALAKKLFGEEE